MPSKPAPTPLEIGAVVKLTYRQLDTEWEALQAEVMAQHGPHVACSPGCAACCTYVVNAADAEAAVVAAAVQAMPPAQRTATIGRLAAWRRAWEHHVQGRATGGVHMAAIVWQRRRLPCPMLDTDTHRCTVYADRPTTCRAHHACQPPPPDTIDESPPTCPTCPAAVPGEGCFASDTDVAHGHHTVVWQISADVQEYGMGKLLKALGRGGVHQVKVGILPLLVLEHGQREYGWPRKPKAPSLQPMASAYPVGDPRRA